MSKKKTNTPLNIAILGANGIGRKHARIFHSLGIKIKAITCSSDKNAAQAAKFLLDSYGIRTKAFTNINDAISEPIDAVSICTPPEYHYEHILTAFNKNLPVFCEKPLFWDSSCNVQYVKSRLEILQNHQHRQLFVNTSNSVLLKAIGNHLPIPNSVKEFSFIFHTQGQYKYEDIAIDLMPHGFSVLLNYFGVQKIHLFNWDVTQNNFRCNFFYGHCNIEFDFHEHHNAKKRLSLSFNGESFERVQKGSGNTYQVYMENKINKNQYESDDPFKVYIANFIKYCQGKESRIEDEFVFSSHNLKLMAYCLEKISLDEN